MQLSNKNIGIITQARMGSTRLPGKVLMKAVGKTMLSYHIERLSWSGCPIFIATTKEEQDKAIVEFCEQNKIICFRGDEDNVLSRFYECALQYNIGIIVRVTSDCPLIDGIEIRQAINTYLEADNAYLYASNCLVRSYPRGFDFEIFSVEALKNAFENATSIIDKEHVTPYINQNRSGKILFKNIVNELDKSQYRITLDTPEDFILISKLINEYNANAMSTEEIILILDNNPQLNAINAHIEQKKIS